MKENKKKTENLILHFAQQGNLHLGKKKLAKLLYFVDFTNQELNGEPITGLKYKRYDYGPIPFKMYDYLKSMNERKLITIKKPLKKYIPETISAKISPDYSVFTKNEEKVIHEVTERFKHETASVVESIAKSEPPYNMVKHNEYIPYHLAYYRNSFDEMSLDENTSP